MKKFILLLICLYDIPEARSQGMFSTIIGDSLQPSTISKAIQTSDGGFLLCGSSFADDYDAGFIKLTADGDTAWSTFLTDTVHGFFSSVIELPGNQGFIAAGVRASIFPVQKDVGLLCRIDTGGTVEWVRAIIHDTLDMLRIYDMVKTDGDSLWVAGHYWDENYDMHLLLMKIDFDGNVIWTKNTPVSPEISGTFTLLPAGGGQCYLGGSYASNQSPFLMKLNESGDIIWTRSYDFFGGPDESIGVDHMDTTCDGNLIITFDSYNWSSGWRRIVYNKTDTSGQSIWSMWPEFESAYTKVYSRPDSSYMILESSYSFNGIKISIIDSLGNLLSTFRDTTIDGSVAVPNLIKTVSGRPALYSGSYFFLGDSLGHSLCNQVPEFPFSIQNSSPVTSSLISPVLIPTTVIDTPLTIYSRRGLPVTSGCGNVSVPDGLYIESDFNLFPNPANNHFTLSNNQYTIKAISIYNIVGDLVNSVDAASLNKMKEAFIDVSFLSSGIYFVKVHDHETFAVKKLLIKKDK